MVADEFRRAIEAAPRMDLDKIAALMWRACADDRITEAEVTDLSNLIDLRRIVPEVAKAPRRSQGSRPRTPDSMRRRRRLAASGRLPPALASHFTLAEMAVMAVVAMEVLKEGQCRMCIERIAACAGVCRTTVKNAMRHAKELKLITVEERRQTFWRNLTNVVRIVSPEWEAWNRLAPVPYHLRGGGKVPTGTSNLNKEGAENGPGWGPKGCRKKAGGPGSGGPPEPPPPKSTGAGH